MQAFVQRDAQPECGAREVVTTHRTRRAGAWPGLVGLYPMPTMSVAYSPDGRRLAVSLARMSTKSYAPVGERLFMLDAASGRLVWQRRYPLRPDQKEAHVRFGPDGVLITSAPQGETLLWNARTGRIVRRFPIGGRLAISPDGRLLALTLNSPYAGEPSGRVGIIDLHTGRHRMLEQELPDAWITSVAFTGDSKQVVAAAKPATYVGDIASGRIVQTLGSELAAEPPTAVVDRRGLILVASDDGSVNAFDPSGVLTLGRRFAPTPKDGSCPGGAGMCIVVDPRGALMATSIGTGGVALFELRSKRLRATLPARGGVMAGVAFMAGGRELIATDSTRTVSIWDVPSRAVVRPLRFTHPASAVTVSPDDRLLAVQTQSADGVAVEVRDLATDRTLYTHELPFGPGEYAFSADSRTLAVSSCCVGGGEVMGWDARSGAPLYKTLASDYAWEFAITARTLAYGTLDGRVVVVDARTGRRRGRAFKPARGGVGGMAFSPGGQLLAVVGGTGTVTLWDLRTRRRVGDTFPTAPNTYPVIAFRPNGRLLIQMLDGTIEWPLERATLQRFACGVVARDLTREGWGRLLPNRPYRRVCT